MQFVMFTKHLQGLSLAELIAALTEVGVEGADLAVRPGYPVDPDNMVAELPAAARRFADAGLTIPLVTAPTSLTSPASPNAEAFYEACGAAEVGHLKLGYWHWDPRRRFWDQIAEIRSRLATFAEWSRQYGVKTVVHNHSGHSLGMNSSQMMHIVQGFDPAQVGVFADPGHLAVCGEPIAMALEMVRDYLACVACKDLLRVAVPEGRGWWGRGEPNRTFTVPLGRGFADYDAALATLRRIGFAGVMSVHSEYDEPVADVIAMSTMDLRYLKAVLDSTEADAAG